MEDICARNKFAVGDRLQIIHSAGNSEIMVEIMLNKKAKL